MGHSAADAAVGLLKRDWILYSDYVAGPRTDLVVALWNRNMLHALEAIAEVT